jgi:hypothetical protein
MLLAENPMRGLSRVYDIFIGFVARHNKDGLLRGRQMSGARPIKILYTLRFAKIGRVFRQYHYKESFNDIS